MINDATADAFPSVAVTIVTYNSAKYIRQCLRNVLNQDYPRFEVIVIDNASADGTTGILRDFENVVKVVYNRLNVGFAAGQNQAIGVSSADWLLTLNPDVRLSPGFISNLVGAGDIDPGIGTVCGKLLSMSPDFQIPERPVFDSTGIYMTLNFRHFDRGTNMPDDGRFDRCEYVFGATGAAALYRREMIRDISIDGEFFDSDFFAYREDADVAWRAQLLGWKCLYTPHAVAYHVRSVLPTNRGSLPAVINMHSVKNRFLLRIKNTTAALYRRHWLAVTVRDCTVIMACLLNEWTSLGAFPFILRNLRRTWRKRKAIMQKRRSSDGYMATWFTHEPVFAAPALDTNRGEKIVGH